MYDQIKPAIFLQERLAVYGTLRHLAHPCHPTCNCYVTLSLLAGKWATLTDSHRFRPQPISRAPQLRCLHVNSQRRVCLQLKLVYNR